ncbi:hypothetical protein TNCT_597941, partial [Trichonephila clavata]
HFWSLFSHRFARGYTGFYQGKTLSQWKFSISLCTPALLGVYERTPIRKFPTAKIMSWLVDYSNTSTIQSRVLKTPLVCEEHEKQVFLRLTIARLRSFNADQRRSLGPFGLWSRRRCHGNYTSIRANTSRSSKSSERVNHIAFLCVIIKRKARREISNKVKDMIEHGEINYCDVVFENQLRC